jgi:hypothetical protein
VTVNECPLQFIPQGKRTREDHAIVIVDILIPLQITGVTSYFNVQKPNEVKLNDDVTYRHVHATNDRFWDPMDTILSENESNLRFALPINVPYTPERYVRAITVSETNNTNELYHQVVSTLEMVATGTRRKGTITAAELSKKWFIGVETARRTLDRTIQLGVRDFLNVKGTRRLQHTAHQLMYRQLKTDVYTDTMFSKV